MSHLTADELSAQLDGGLDDAARARAEGHLAECSECRDALVALAEQERALGPALEHDPGDAYFESFAARVEDRIRAAGLKGAQARQGDGWMAWLRSPGRLAWVGGVAAVVVGAGVVMLTTRLERPDLRSYQEKQAPSAKSAPLDSTLPDRDATYGEVEPTRPSADASRTRAAEPGGAPAAPRAQPLQKGESDFARPPAPVRTMESKLGLARDEASPSSETKEAASRKDARGLAAPQRLTESRRTAAGEDVPVARQGAPPAPVPAPSASAPAPEQAQIVKPRATPAGKAGVSTLTAEPERATSADLNNALSEGATVPLCGRVVDPNGRAVSRARVTLVENGRSVATDANGRFCIDAAPGEHSLSVMAVGFDETRLTARAGSGLPVAVTLGAVSVLDPTRSLAGARDGAKRIPGFVSGEPSDVFSALPDSLRARVREAQAAVADGRARGSAARLDQGAERWEGVLVRISSGALQAEARFRLAEARYLAWLHAPARQDGPRAPSARRDSAITAIRGALEAPASRAQSQTLRTWLRELAP